MRGSLACSIASCGGLICLPASVGCGTGTDLNQVVNVDPRSGSSPMADGGSDQGSSFPDPFAGAPAYVSMIGGQSHNPGKACLQSGCHGAGGDGPGFLIGGTVYADYKATTGAAGVEVRIVDSAGRAASTYTGSNGNFYLHSSSAGVAFPALVGARDATTSRPMISTLTGNMGSCGQSSCHAPGGGPMTGTGNYYPIHVP